MIAVKSNPVKRPVAKARVAKLRKKKTAEPRYQMIITWSDDDDCFVVEVPEIPGCMTDGKTYAEAVEMGLDAIRGTIEVLQELGRPIPQPRSYQERKNRS